LPLFFCEPSHPDSLKVSHHRANLGIDQAEPLLVEVKWPDGVCQRIESPDVNSELRLAHPHAGGLVFVTGFESRQ